jgi:hypothetical protein
VDELVTHSRWRIEWSGDPFPRRIGALGGDTGCERAHHHGHEHPARMGDHRITAARVALSATSAMYAQKADVRRMTSLVSMAVHASLPRAGP